MEQLHKLHQRLGKCYQKYNYVQYFHLREENKNKICKSEKEALIDYVKSDSLSHENILKARIAEEQSKYLNF
jgi:hypothetical protein